MYKLRRRLSQNFLHSRKLISKLVRSSSIGKNDLVLEIGPGKGIITKQLVQQAQHVFAVELDSHWYKYLQNKFIQTDNLILYQGDFLNFSLPALPYKVFANIPFSIEGRTIRKLIDAKNPPEDCYLVVRKELAYRLFVPYRENQFSLMHKPWFNFSIFHHFNRNDFSPATKVNIVMIRFKKRSDMVLSLSEKPNYQKFIQLGFGHGLEVFKNLNRVYGYNKTLNTIRKLQIKKDARPSQLSLQQWINLYREFIV